VVQVRAGGIIWECPWSAKPAEDGEQDHMSETISTACECTVKLRARDVSAIIHKGYLLGTVNLEPNDPRRKLEPMVYEFIDFCAKPTCEKVYKSERKASE
jgi:hypothetical protein